MSSLLLYFWGGGRCILIALPTTASVNAGVLDIVLFLSANAAVKSSVNAADVGAGVAAIGVVVVAAVVVAVLRVVPSLLSSPAPFFSLLLSTLSSAVRWPCQ